MAIPSFARVARRVACLLSLTTAHLAGAQGAAILTGTVTDEASGKALAGIHIDVSDGRAASTDGSGRYRLAGIAAGTYTVRFRWLGYAPRTETVTLAAGETRTLDLALRANPVQLGLVRVSGASRTPERLVDAPAAIISVEPDRVRDLAATGQLPMLVADQPGVRAAQAGLFDFNLNTRGFNTPLNRRTLVLVDGRDVSIPLLGNQEWADLLAFEDATQVEMVRGPGAALYGANAFSGVLAITTPSVRETPGTRVDLTTGMLGALRADVRQAWLTDDGRWGVRVSAGWQQSRAWDRARTALGDVDAEYERAGFAPGTVHYPAPGYEVLPLAGQTKAGAFGVPGEASGTPDPVRVQYGTVRADRYRRDGAVLTVEGGASRVENSVINTGVSRSQVVRADRPWARVALTARAYSVFAYYTGRDGEQVSLASGTPGIDRGGVWHLEGQRTFRFAGDRGRWVVGASVRQVRNDSEGTVLAAAEDDRRDDVFAVFQQVDWSVTPTLKAVLGARYDDGTMFEPQASPRFGLVYTPAPDQTLRLTWNRGYLAASPFQRFLRFPAGAPQDLSALEAGLRASPLGPALAGVADGTLFTTSSAVPVFALGNASLRPEVVTGIEAGYKLQRGRLYATIDVYTSTITDFATSLLPGRNAAYGAWTAPDAVPEPARDAVAQAVIGALGRLITRLPDGSTAMVVSFGNAGRATERGAELALAWQATDRVRLETNYTFYDFSLEQGSFAAGDTISANAPAHQANVAATWQAPRGLRLRLGARYQDAFAARTGAWVATLPAATAIDLHARLPLGDRWSVSLAGTNVLDQRRVQVLGGSAIERRALVTLGWRR